MVRRRSLFRRPRVLGAALIGGLGFAAGRASRRPSGGASEPAVPADPADLAASLKDLADMHEAGSLTDDEYAAAKAKLLA
jgi:hypothetical protein